VTVDAQRRLTIPKGWRLPSDGEDTVFYLLPDRSSNHWLRLETRERVERIYDEVEESSLFGSSEENQALMEVFSKMQEVTMDKQGRFALSPQLAEFAQIKDKAVFLGAGLNGIIAAPENCGSEQTPSDTSLGILQKLQAAKRS